MNNLPFYIRHNNWKNSLVFSLSNECRIVFFTGPSLQCVFLLNHSIYKFQQKYNPQFPRQGIVWGDCSTLLYSQSLKVTAVSLLSQIAGMAFFSTGNCSFQCTPRHGKVGNQCTALIKTLTSCLHRKLTCLLLISCRSHSVCEIVLPITTCLSMTTSTRMWPYQ